MAERNFESFTVGRMSPVGQTQPRRPPLLRANARPLLLSKRTISVRSDRGSHGPIAEITHDPLTTQYRSVSTTRTCCVALAPSSQLSSLGARFLRSRRQGGIFVQLQPQQILPALSKQLPNQLVSIGSPITAPVPRDRTTFPRR